MAGSFEIIAVGSSACPGPGFVAGRSGCFRHRRCTLYLAIANRRGFPTRQGLTEFPAGGAGAFPGYERSRTARILIDGSRLAAPLRWPGVVWSRPGGDRDSLRSRES
jgi:hypothetical protein